jgi:O-antigen/teichoic acid export membrane protein
MSTPLDTTSSTRASTGHALGDVKELKSDLASYSLRGSSSLAISEIGSNVFRLLGTIMLARLLTPEYFGLIGIMTALTAFAEMFKDLGLGIATIQRKEITHSQISTLFWVNLAIGVGLMLLVAASAPLLVWFYDEPRLLWIAFAISSTFIFGGLTIQHQALMRRQMRFPQLALTQVISTGLSTLVGILLAWLGFEYWALVWKEISRSIIQAAATWIFCRWLPGWPTRGAGVRSMFQTGSHVTGFNVLAFAARSLDTVLLGKVWGAEFVGLYKQAGLLLLMPVSLFSYPITNVMTSALSALQGESERYRNYYKKVVEFLAFGYIPCITYIAVYAESLVSLILGEKWLAASPVLQIGAGAVALEPIMGTCGIVMITCGRTREYMYLGVAQALFLAIAFCIGVNWGMLGLAWAGVVYAVVSLPFLLQYSFKETPISPHLFYEAIKWPVVASVVLAIAMISIRHLMQIQNLYMELLCSVCLAPLLYCSIWLIFPNGGAKLSEFFSHFQDAGKAILAKIGLSQGQAPSRS